MVFANSNMSSVVEDYSIQGAKKVHFSPYSDNGGSIIAVGGEGFAVIAADTRLSSGYSTLASDQQKLFPLSDKTVLAATGCWCDVLTLTRLLAARMQMYKHEHQKEMSTSAAAQMLSTMLYYKRFFPYYVSNILAGLDANGNGCVYAYDPIGHMEKHTYRAAGSSGPLLQPFLDNQIGYKNQEGAERAPLTQEKAVALVKDTFIAAAERDIATGDGVNIRIITKDGTKDCHFELRKD